MVQLVIPYEEKPVTTSSLVAGRLGKRHAEVLRALRDLECSSTFRIANFIDTTQEDTYGRKNPLVIMTRDGFTMLMMSLKGGVAAKFREEFIEEFNKMEETLKYGATPKLIPTYQMRILSNPAKSLPYTHWSVFSESHGVLLLIESNIGSVNKYDLADGSIGRRWSDFRKGKEWAVETSNYVHEFDDKRGDREALCYQLSELPHFKKWLEETYKINHLYKYLHDKYKKEKNTSMLFKVETVLPKLLVA